MARPRAGAALSCAVALVLVGCASPPTPTSDVLSGTVTVLAAASLTEAFDEIAAAFEDAHPEVDVRLSYGGSSALAEQVMTGGIPADVLATANEATMKPVVEREAAAASELFAGNVLVLAVPPGNPWGITEIAHLARPEPAIALCDHAVPCGAATDELLALAGVTAAPDTLEPDVKAVLTRIALGEADAGLVYATDAMAAGDRVHTIAVPEAAEVVNRYPIAMLADAPNPGAAAAFVAFVLGPDGQAILRAAGFRAP